MVFDIQRFIPATSGKMYKQYDFPEHETKVLVEKDVEYIDDNGQKQTRKDMVPLLKTKSVLEFVSLPGGPGTTARPGGWTADQLLDNAETLLQQVIAASSAVTVDEEGADVPLRQLLSDPQFVFAEGMDTVAVKYFATGPDPLTTLYIHVSSGDQLAGWSTFFEGVNNVSRRHTSQARWAMAFADRLTADFVQAAIGLDLSSNTSAVLKQNLDHLMRVREVAQLRSYLTATASLLAITMTMTDGGGCERT